jgi:hypothetical protein
MSPFAALRGTVEVREAEDAKETMVMLICSKLLQDRRLDACEGPFQMRSSHHAMVLWCDRTDGQQAHNSVRDNRMRAE